MALKRRHHQLIRLLCLVVAGSSLAYVGSRSRVRADLTEEGLSQITPATQLLIESIDESRPVTVHAFISEEVPREYVTVRSRLLNILREMEASGGPGLRVRIVEPEVFSPEAEEAMENFGIMPRPLVDRSSGRVESMETFLGLAFVSGPNEEVVEFLDRGMSPEYEVARALRVVTQEEKKVVGIVRTDATIMGNFDLQARRQQPAWQIVEELRKQYEVRSLNPATPVPEDVDVLFVPQLSSLAQAELDNVRAYVDEGRPALLTVDPMPLFDIRLSPTEDKLPPPGQQGGMFGQQAPSEPKGDYLGLLRDVGVQWSHTQILYDTNNRPPMFEQAPPHIVFIDDPEDAPAQLGTDPAIEGLDEVVVMYPGEISPAEGFEEHFDPLLRTSRGAGFNAFDDMVDRHPLFGIQPRPPRTRSPITGKQHVMAARVEREGGGGDDAPKPRNVVVLADLDMFGNLFFEMHQRGGDLDGDGLDDVRFDNVPFLLNLIDSLAGDDRFIELRKRRQEYRRLTEVDALTQQARLRRQEQIEEANAEAEAELEEAQKALDAEVAAIRERTDLDDTTKAIMLKSKEEAENRRLKAKQDKIERDKQRAMAKTETEHRRAVDEVQNRIRLLSVLVPPIPALLLGVVIFARKRRRERESIPMSRRKGAVPSSATPTASKPGKSGGEG